MDYYDAIELWHVEMSNAMTRKQRIAATVRLADAISDSEKAADMHEAWIEQERQDAREMQA